MRRRLSAAVLLLLPLTPHPYPFKPRQRPSRLRCLTSSSDETWAPAAPSFPEGASDAAAAARRRLLRALSEAGASEDELRRLGDALPSSSWRRLAASPGSLAQVLAWASGPDGAALGALLQIRPEVLGREAELGRLGGLLSGGLTLPDVAAMMTTAPGVLEEDGAEMRTVEVLDFLTTQPRKNPLAGLTTIPAGVLDAGRDILEEEGLGLRRQDARRLLRNAPGILAAVVLERRPGDGSLEATMADGDEAGFGINGDDASEARAAGGMGGPLLMELAPLAFAWSQNLEQAAAAAEFSPEGEEALGDMLERPKVLATSTPAASGAPAPQANGVAEPPRVETTGPTGVQGTPDAEDVLPPPMRNGARASTARAAERRPRRTTDDAFRAWLEEEEEERQRSLPEDLEAADGGVEARGGPTVGSKGATAIGRRWCEVSPRERLERSTKALAALGLASKSIRADARRPPKASAAAHAAVCPLPGGPASLQAPLLPTLLQTPTPTLFRFAAFLARREVNVSPQTLAGILRDAPAVPPLATSPAEAAALAKATFCADLLYETVDRAAVAAVGTESAVALLSRRLREEEDEGKGFAPSAAIVMEAPLQFLTDIGVDDNGGDGTLSGLEKALRAQPGLLVADVATQLAPVAMFLAVDLGLGVANAARVLVAYPALFLKDVHQELEPIANVFCDFAGMELGEPLAARVFRAFPALLALDPVRDVAPVVQFIQSATRCDDAEVAMLLRALPSVVGYDLEGNIWPKIEFLFGYCRLEVQRLVSGFPAALAYPLVTVIEPRFEFLAAMRILGKGSGGYNAALAAKPSQSWATQELRNSAPPEVAAEGPAPPMPSPVPADYIMNQVLDEVGGLGPVLARGDVDFAKNVAKVPPHIYMEFKNEYLERRKLLKRTRGPMDPHVLDTARGAGFL